jgi:two-component system, LuxR family, response regulator FixJ
MDPHPVPAKASRIVLVDDDPAIRTSLQFSFELEGFTVEAYDSGESASAADLPSEGCLVLDQQLPGMDGLELLQRLRERQVSLPAVLITTHPDRRLRARARAAGVEIVEKPLLGDALADSVRSALRSR